MGKVLDPSKIQNLLHKNEIQHSKNHRYLDTAKRDFEIMLAAIKNHDRRCYFPDWGWYTIRYYVNNFGDDAAWFTPVGKSLSLPCGGYPIKQFFEREMMDSGRQGN